MHLCTRIFAKSSIEFEKYFEIMLNLPKTQRMRAVLFFSFLVLNIYSQCQVVLIDEDFSNGFPSGWMTSDIDGLTPNSTVDFMSDAWVVTEDFDNPGSGDSVLTSTSYYSSVGTSNDWVISPKIGLGSFGNKLFFNAKAYDASFADGYEVRWSSYSEIDSFLVNEPLLVVDAESSDWEKHYIILDSAGVAGDSIHLAWRNNSTDKFLLSIDSILVVKEVPVDVVKEIEIKVDIYPIPAQDWITISSERSIRRMHIYDLNGVMVMKIKGRNMIDISMLPAGTYTCKVDFDHGSTSTLVIKE